MPPKTETARVLFYAVAHGEQAWLFLEPDTGLDHCSRILLSCFRTRISALEPAGMEGMDR